MPPSRREQHYNWNGGKTTNSEGYVKLLRPEHPLADSKGYVREHVLIAEGVLGKPLPTKAVVHHVDNNPSNNAKNNLVICENQAYHRLLHRRTIAFRASGHADWRQCWYCKLHGDPSLMAVTQNYADGQYYHLACRRAARRPQTKENI